MAKQAVYTMPVVSFRKLETPSTAGNHHDYYTIVDSRELPDLKPWREINVRDPKLRGSVPNSIREGFRDTPNEFVFMNRGLVISAADITFDNKTNKVQFTLENKRLHGLLDGGHTYNILREENSGRDETELPVYVKVEFITGFACDEIPRIVDARNTSNQVKDESLMNLAGDFNSLKQTLNGQHYWKDIAWQEFEVADDGSAKPIDIREIIAILMCFDRDNFTASAHPINAYRSKSAALNHFKKHMNSFKKLYGIANYLVRLHDEIYLALPELYNKARKKSGLSSGRFGALTGVTTYDETSKRRADLYYLGTQSNYGIPTGFIYPLLGAFRALLVEDEDGNYKFPEDLNPIDLLKNGDLGLELVAVLSDFALETQNPSKVGKSPNVWKSCYTQAEVAMLRQQRQQLGLL